jgi:hypothetical protein
MPQVQQCMMRLKHPDDSKQMPESINLLLKDFYFHTGHFVQEIIESPKSGGIFFLL